MTNEPTTGEIVRALRCVAEAIECKDCRYKYPVGNVILCDHEQMNRNAADRLESQEQLIERLFEYDNGIHFGNKYYDGYDAGYQAGWQVGCDNEEMAQMIEALIDRVESAEQERDDIEKGLARRIMKHLSDNEFDSTDVCEICEYNLINSPKCLSCGSDHHYGENFELKHTLRGLPQDGEEK